MRRVNYCENCGHYDWACTCADGNVAVQAMQKRKANLPVPPTPTRNIYTDMPEMPKRRDQAKTAEGV